jgi:Tol biopolymer transport system component
MKKSLHALLVVVTLALALCVISAPALATSNHVLFTSFGEPGSGDGQLKLIANETQGGSGVAVNDTTHDVYVADTGNHRVDEFSSSGTFIRAWGWGVADGSTEALQSCTSGCHAGLPGSGAGQLNEPTSIAVDDSGGPSQGDVYVADTSNGSASVSKYSASGAYISTTDGAAVTFPIAGPFGPTVAGIAVDAAGDLWVIADGPGEFGPGEGLMFEFAQDGAFITGWSPASGGVTRIGLAIDSSNDLDLRGFGGLSRYTPAGVVLGVIKQYPPFTGIAVDSSSDDLFVDEGEQIAHYAASCDPSKRFCTPVDSFGAGELNGAAQLAVDPSNDTVYAANTNAGQIAIFGRTPDVSTGQPANRTATTATLSGTVSPDNTTVGDCHFDYVTSAEYQAGEPNPYAAGGTVPCDITPAGSGTVTVHAEASGLTPGVAYHFRLEATNLYGTSFGADETVPGTPPAIVSTSASDVASASAELHATINPDGGDTTYHFEYGTTTSYGSSIPVPDADIGSGVNDVTVSRRIQGLLANTTYHYRVLAHNPLGSTAGPDYTITTPPASGGGSADTCVNAALRAQQQATVLPDCRAYEQVSPPNRDGAPILGGSGRAQWQASADGSAIAYTSGGVFAGALTSDAVFFPYIGSRTQGGWSTHSLLPPQAPGSILPFTQMGAYSADLSKAVLIDGGGSTLYGQDEPRLVPGEPEHNTNLFLRDDGASSYQLVDVTPQGAAPAEAVMLQASPDLSHVVFEEGAQLTPDAPAGGFRRLYDWGGGSVHLVGIFPDGTPMPASVQAITPKVGRSAVGSSVLDNHAVSADGSRIYFGTLGSVNNLYLRQNDTSTVQVDASHGPGPGGHGEFEVASSDGSQAFFLDDATEGLTNDTVPGSGANLYRYDANGGTLTDLTPAASAEVLGVLGASEDGSYVYFTANGVLAPGASPGNCTGGFGAPSETCNLYLSHNGAITFIAAMNGEDLSDWHQRAIGLNDTAVVSPDGRHLAFESRNSPTGYDNVAANGVQCGTDTHASDASPQARCNEVFLYAAVDGSSGKLSCASCNPSGGAPVGSSRLAVPQDAANQNNLTNYMPRFLSDSGRLFFNSLDALAPQDVNGQWDVYEYEPAGTGSCGRSQGCVSPISSGTSPDASVFIDASVTGEDVFFLTSDRLVAQDGDQSPDLYDAKVDGGIASQNEPPASPCGGEACKPPASSQPAEQTPGSSGVSGSGNLTPSTPVSSHGKPLKKRHPVKKRHQKKKKKKKSRRARGRRANHNHRGAK